MNQTYEEDQLDMSKYSYGMEEEYEDSDDLDSTNAFLDQ